MKRKQIMPPKKGKLYIAIITYNRPLLLKQLLDSVRLLVGIEKYKVLIIQQEGSDQVSKVIALNRDLFDDYLIVSPNSGKVEQKIAENRLTAYRYVFEENSGSAVIILEEDVVVSPDALVFFEMALSRYSEKGSFMGVNFGSVEPPRPNSESEYFMQRFGLHGPASGITRKTWQGIKPHLNSILTTLGHFDLAFEFFLRQGFMVSPSRSRYLDLGVNGTHTGSGELPYFSGLSTSWLSEPNLTVPSKWELANPSRPFRDDCFDYRPYENLFFKALWQLRILESTKTGSVLFKGMYKFFYLRKCRQNNDVSVLSPSHYKLD
jgi:hypothetical protein